MAGMGISGTISKALAPRISQAAPGMTVGFVRESLERAIRGVGPLPGAATTARRQLDEQHGDVDKAIRDLIEMHVRYAGAQGFVTSIGGLITAAVSIPANIAGLALIHCRMVAGIASLRGYDLEDPRVRNAILATILGEDDVEKMVRKRRLPAPPMALATAPRHDPHLDRVVAGEVASELITRVAGKRLASTIGRRVPVVGGVVGLTVDGFETWRIGRYADRELLPRARR
jgi:hypothetical protein